MGTGPVRRGSGQGMPAKGDRSAEREVPAGGVGHSAVLGKQDGPGGKSDSAARRSTAILFLPPASGRWLAKRHLAEGATVLYDVSRSYYEGRHCPLAVFGHSRDGKKGKPIIVYGVLSDRAGRPLAVDVYAGNTADPTTLPDQVAKLRRRFGLSRVVLVGDRGLLTQTQIDQLRQHPGLGWISALRSGSIRELVAGGYLPLSLFDEQNLAEIRSPDYPGERLIACYNPLLADQRRRKREELLAATEKELERIAAEVKRRTRTPLTADQIGLKLGRVLNRYKVGKHFATEMADGVFAWSRREESIQREAALDGLYVIRSSEKKRACRRPTRCAAIRA